MDEQHDLIPNASSRRIQIKNISKSARIRRMNTHLRKIGSRFGTEDGVNFLIMLRADKTEIRFLRKTYDTIDEAETAILALKPRKAPDSPNDTTIKKVTM